MAEPAQAEVEAESPFLADHYQDLRRQDDHGLEEAAGRILDLLGGLDLGHHGALAGGWTSSMCGGSPPQVESQMVQMMTSLLKIQDYLEMMTKTIMTQRELKYLT